MENICHNTCYHGIFLNVGETAAFRTPVPLALVAAQTLSPVYTVFKADIVIGEAEVEESNSEASIVIKLVSILT
jgi:hypothetical protein